MATFLVNTEHQIFAGTSYTGLATVAVSATDSVYGALIGGTLIEDWASLDPGELPTAEDILGPTEYAKIRKAPYTTPAGTMNWDNGAGTSTSDAGRAQAVPPCLIYGGERMPVSRYPATGWMLSESSGTIPTYPAGAIPVPYTDWIYLYADGWTFGNTGVRYKGFPQYDYVCRVCSLDAADGFDGTAIIVTQPTSTQRTGHRFCLEHLAAGMLVPGNWWIDETNEMLYFYPPDDDLVVTNTYVSDLNASFFDITSCTNVTFDDIEFIGGRKYQVKLTACTSVVFNNCTFNASGLYAIHANANTKIHFYNCTFKMNGSAGAYIFNLTNTKNTLAPTDCYFKSCTFEDGGQTFITGTSGANLRIYGATLEDCTFDRYPHLALTNQAKQTTLRCDFTDICTETNDAGAIYGGQSWKRPGSQVRNCTFTNVYDRVNPASTALVHPVYCDDQFSGCLVEGCTMTDCQTGAFFGGGWKNRFINNTVNLGARGTRHVVIDNRGEEGSIVPNSQGSGPPLYTGGGSLWKDPYSDPANEAPWSSVSPLPDVNTYFTTEFPWIAALPSEEYDRCMYNVIANNTTTDGTFVVYKNGTFAPTNEQAGLTISANSIIAPE